LVGHDESSSSSPTPLTQSSTGSAAGGSGGGGGRETIPFLLADIGEGIKEVELLQWYVQPGDHVRQFDRICEVQSDKATVEITSRYDGVVEELSGQVGDMMQVGRPLLHVRTESRNSGENGGRSHPETSPPQLSNPFIGGSSTVASSEQQRRERTLSAILREDAVWDGASDYERLNIPTIASHYLLDSDEDAVSADGGSKDLAALPSDVDIRRSSFQASPAVRRLGKEYRLDLSTIHPSGPHGRLLKSDVVTYLKEQGLWKGEEEPDTLQNDPQLGSRAPSRPPDLRVHGENTEDRIVQLKGYHRLMMQSMTAALQIPHMGFGDELVVTELVRHRRELNDALVLQHQASFESGDPSAEPLRLSMLTLLIKACSLSLSEHPMVNAVVHNADACQLRLSSNHNIGIAVDTPRGLVVPVIHSVQSKSPVEIQQGK
jgi:2-oxoisovalerate dehydrogenase E2 component (dihydrolipoyl transacylase)